LQSAAVLDVSGRIWSRLKRAMINFAVACHADLVGIIKREL